MVVEYSLRHFALMDDEEEAAKVFWGTCHGRSHEFQSQLNGIDFVEALNSQGILVTMNKI